MDSFSRSALQDSAVKLVLGFVGTILAFSLLPRTIKFVSRKFLLGIFAEVVTVVVAGLLAEKAAEKVTADE